MSPVFPLKKLSRYGRICLSATALFVLSFPGKSGAAETIQPPFNLQWETGGRELEARLTEAKATIADRKRLVDGEIWKVEGLPQPGLRSVLFTLKDDELVGVELQYSDPQWDIWTYDEFVHRVRINLDARFGTGKQIARRREGTDVLQTLIGYSWKAAQREIELIYFAAQDEKNALRLVSLHYKSGAAQPTEGTENAAPEPAPKTARRETASPAPTKRGSPDDDAALPVK